MEYFIEVMFETPEPVKFKGRPCFRLRGSAIDSVNMPLEVFIHRRSTVDPITSEQTNEFMAIASPYDLSYYPANEPDDELDAPFFRLSSFDILLPGVDVTYSTIAEIKRQLAFLCGLMRKLDEMQTIEIVWIPGEPPEDEETPTTTTPAP